MTAGIRRLGRCVLGVTRGIVVLTMLWIAIENLALPNTRQLARTIPRTTSYMRYRESSLGLPAGTYAARPRDRQEISAYLLCALAKTEDVRFFNHHGFDLRATSGVLTRAVAGGQATGASTISQQLARNLFLTPERTARRKLREALLTVQIEGRLDKARILELYANVIEWGDGVWGVGDAARYYFGKEASELDLFESTFLAALVAAPRAPVLGRNASRVERVQARVLVDLRNAGLTEPVYVEAAKARQRLVWAAIEKGIPLQEALAEKPDAALYPPAPLLTWMEVGRCWINTQAAQ